MNQHDTGKYKRNGNKSHFRVWLTTRHSYRKHVWGLSARCRGVRPHRASPSPRRQVTAAPSEQKGAPATTWDRGRKGAPVTEHVVRPSGAHAGGGVAGPRSLQSAAPGASAQRAELTHAYLTQMCTRICTHTGSHAETPRRRGVLSSSPAAHWSLAGSSRVGPTTSAPVHWSFVSHGRCRSRRR